LHRMYLALVFWYFRTSNEATQFSVCEHTLFEVQSEFSSRDILQSPGLLLML